MNNLQLQQLIEYRLAQAKETLRESELLLEAAAFRGSVNRSYYAMFYAVLSLLATRGLGTSKHGGVMSFFDREFVKAGLVDKQFSRSLHRAFDERQANDYGELLKPDQTLALGLLQQAQEFVQEIERQLGTAGFDI